MRALIDTNILVDYISERQPFFQDAYKIVDACDKSFFSGCIAAHSIPDIFYILRKSIPAHERRDALRRLCEIFEVIGIDKGKLISALDDENFFDFEDCLQVQCATTYSADYIVTRNLKDFAMSIIPAITPDKFCQQVLKDLLMDSDKEGK